MRKHALRAHFIYNVKIERCKRESEGGGKWQETAWEHIHPVASQFQLRTFLAITALRLYSMIQMGAYLHADIIDDVYIVIPPGFPGAGEIGRLD